MKLIHLLAMLAAIALPAGLTSCSTTGGAGTTTSNYTPFIAPAAALATAAVLDKAVSADDRSEKAALATKVAAALSTITDPDTTGKEVAAVVLAETGPKPHWIAFAQVVSLLYDRYSERIGASKYSVVLHELSTGITTGAAPCL